MPKPRYPIVEFDKLQMYFREPYVIDLPYVLGAITVYQPTIGDIMKIGEKRFYSTLNIFIANTTMYRAFLWELGKDWNELSDFELWLMLLGGIDEEVVSMLFGDLDFKKFKLYQREKEVDEEIIEELFLFSEELEIEITEEVYQHFHQYIQAVFSMSPEEEFTKDNMLKKWWINKDKKKAERNKGKNEESQSTMLSLISSCVNHPGFKYKVDELKEIGVCQFYDSVKRLQVYENATAIQKGMYAGLALGGAKDLKSDDYNFMREI